MPLNDPGFAKVLGEAIDKAKATPVELTRALTADIVRTIMEGAEKHLPLEEVYAQLDLRHARFYEDLKPFLKESA